MRVDPKVMSHRCDKMLKNRHKVPNVCTVHNPHTLIKI